MLLTTPDGGTVWVPVLYLGSFGDLPWNIGAIKLLLESPKASRCLEVISLPLPSPHLFFPPPPLSQRHVCIRFMPWGWVDVKPLQKPNLCSVNADKQLYFLVTGVLNAFSLFTLDRLYALPSTMLQQYPTNSTPVLCLTKVSHSCLTP